MALVNVTARPSTVIVTPHTVEIQSSQYLQLVRPAQPVLIDIRAHDTYFLEEKRRWRQRLAAVHPDKVDGSHQQAAHRKRRAHNRFIALGGEYAVWLRQEREWYKVAGLSVPR